MKTATYSHQILQHTSTILLLNTHSFNAIKNKNYSVLLIKMYTKYTCSCKYIIFITRNSNKWRHYKFFIPLLLKEYIQPNPNAKPSHQNTHLQQTLK